MSTRELIVASAGSGKTFQISSRIIAALADEVVPSSIFASTFTRAAAGEILERVLVRMSRAALDEDQATALSEQLSELPNAPGVRDSEGWRVLLLTTARELHAFDIGTLDSWFQRTARAFGHDLGLPPGWSIAEDTLLADARADVLDAVLAEGDRGQALQLVREVHGGEARRRVQGSLVEAVESLVEIQSALDPSGPGWSAASAFTEGPDRDLDSEIAALVARWRALEIPTTKAGSPRKAWETAVRNAVEDIEARSWERFTGRGLFPKYAEAAPDEVPVYSGAEIEPDAIELLRDTAAVAAHDLAGVLARRGRALGQLAEAYNDAWRDQVARSGRLGFDDVARHLSGPREPTGRTDFTYRMGGRIERLLLDEFQDTSLLQWRVVAPLLRRVVERSDPDAAGRATVVADPKQSIYGWRGGAPVVLRALGEELGFDRDTMAGSYRSCGPVLDTVNRVFEGIEDTAVIRKEPRDAEPAQQWRSDFEKHTVALRPGETTRPGEVALWVGPGTDPDEGPDLLAWAADRIAALVAEHPHASIGVLTRTNRTVARLITELASRGVPASEEGGTRIADSPAVVAVLSLLRIADHPSDRLARWHVAAGPLGAAFTFRDPSDDGRALAISRLLRRRLVEDGYGDTLRRIAESVRDTADARDRKRLGQLVQLGHAWDASGDAGVRVDPFVRRVLEAKAELPGEARVRVMTIHRSKGLEFDVVVLPELGASMFGGGRGRAPAIPYRPDGHGRPTHVFPTMPSWQGWLFEHHAELAGALGQAREAGLRDALGVLYVAMTRARHALHMLVPEDPEAKSGARSPARILVERLAPDAFAEGYEWMPGAETPLWWHPEGDVEWDVVLEPSAALADRATGEVPSTAERIEFRTAPRRRMIERRSPSSEEGGQRIDLGFALGEGALAAREKGSVVHAWLEAVEWLDPSPHEPPAPGMVLDDDARLHAIARREAPTADRADVAAWAEWLRARLAAPDVRATLARARYPDDAVVSVEPELPFLWRDDREHVMVEGFIDRFVLLQRDGEVVGAEILDWKTDVIDSADADALPAKIEHYAPQIRRYREAVADLYGLAPDRITGTLVFLEVGAVVDVPPGPGGRG
jgi:ATP-dependent exoDNAse (exonuclease V) beta subunit